MFIRPANVADAPQIAQVHVKTWRNAYRGLIPEAVLDAQSIERRALFWHERIAQNKDAIFVAEDRGVLGFCNLIPSRDADADDTVAEIAAIYVLSAYWRRGVGRALCGDALAEAQRQGYRAVTLWVLAANERAKRFYGTMGFSLDGAKKTEKASDRSELHEVRLRKQMA